MRKSCSSEVKYIIGHKLPAEEVKVDPNDVQAITDLIAPMDKMRVSRVIGMVNYLTKFVPKLSEHFINL